MQHLILRLEAPLMAFGGETIDNYSFIRRFPSASSLTGLLANALGWRRIEAERHQRLQDRLIFAARIDREPAAGIRLTDFQTAQLGASDLGWTTRGQPEGRAGGANTYSAPHLRFRDYFADMRVTVALRLEPAEESPTLEKLVSALGEPSRPLFIGRKPCLPSSPLFVDIVEGDTSLHVLLASQPEEDSDDSNSLAAMWPANEVVGTDRRVQITRRYMLTDQRNWVSGLHGGGRWVCEGSVRNERVGGGVEPLTPTEGERT